MGKIMGVENAIKNNTHFDKLLCCGDFNWKTNKKHKVAIFGVIQYYLPLNATKTLQL